MAEKAKKSGASLRPHFKTHHSATIANWFRDFGIHKCTASSVSMAKYFSEHGWDDITIAFPYNPLEHEEINELAGKIKLNILIESEESLSHAKDNIKNPLGFFIKIDVGYHRTGVDHRNENLIQALIQQSSPQLTYQGLVAHAGHTYGAGSLENIQWIFSQSEKVLSDLKEKFGGIISYGDTPSCSTIEDLSAFDELRAGNFVFYDWMQRELGSCAAEEIAVCLASPVVSRHLDRKEVVVYGGAVHLSKDSLESKTGKYFGKAVKLNANGWASDVLGTVDRISQEHGVIKMNSDALEQIKVGDIIGILPVHSCLTADLQGHYLSTSGERIEKISKT